jgi:hypothetical protein
MTGSAKQSIARLGAVKAGLLRRFAPRNDGKRVARMSEAKSGAATRDSRIALRSIQATVLVICPTGCFMIWLSSPICKNISVLA